MRALAARAHQMNSAPVNGYIQGESKVLLPWFFSICKKTINARNRPLTANYWY